MYLMRLDDASEYMDLEKWLRMEALLDKYDVKPIFGIIPDNQDPDLLSYGKVNDFWEIVKKWIAKGWIPALHGYSHVFESNEGGVNPVHNKSEFAGLSIDRQCRKIHNGVKILHSHGIRPTIFFAPAHTFDINTLEALRQESDIRIISDTVANKPYERWGFTFIPQQSGKCRKLPFKVTTFCYHPNNMCENDYVSLDLFLNNNRKRFGSFDFDNNQRKRTYLDMFMQTLYNCYRSIK